MHGGIRLLACSPLLGLAAPAGAASTRLAGRGRGHHHQPRPISSPTSRTCRCPSASAREGLDAYYQDERRPALVDRHRAHVRLGRPRCSAAEEDGLDPPAYPAAQLAKLAPRRCDGTDARGKAIVELFFSAAFLEYASDLQVGRFLPRKVDPELLPAGQDHRPARGADRPGRMPPTSIAFFDGWQPQIAGLCRPEGRRSPATAPLPGAGGWPIGSARRRAEAGHERRARAGAPRPPRGHRRRRGRAAAGGEKLYDDELVAAVESFQARHGIDVDGVVGKGTVAALNVPVEDRIEEIVVAMERWRWMPDEPRRRPPDRQHRRLRSEAGRRRQGRRRDGGRRRQALQPHAGVQRSPCAIVELNPYWNVPTGIAIKEELPKLKRNPGGARRLRLRGRARRHGVLPVTAVNWSQYGPGNFPFQLRQKPGPKNALGRGQVRLPQPVQRLPPRHAGAGRLRQDRPRLQPWLHPPVAAGRSRRRRARRRARLGPRAHRRGRRVAASAPWSTWPSRCRSTSPI